VRLALSPVVSFEFLVRQTTDQVSVAESKLDPLERSDNAHPRVRSRLRGRSGPISPGSVTPLAMLAKETRERKSIDNSVVRSGCENAGCKIAEESPRNYTVRRCVRATKRRVRATMLARDATFSENRAPRVHRLEGGRRRPCQGLARARSYGSEGVLSPVRRCFCRAVSPRRLIPRTTR